MGSGGGNERLRVPSSSTIPSHTFMDPVSSSSSSAAAAKDQLEIMMLDEKTPGVLEEGEEEVKLEDNRDEETMHISFRAVERVDVPVRNLSVTVEKPRRSGMFKKKRGNDVEGGKEVVRILNDVSADMPSGELTAIIGGSGSGKTTMLNAMSHRMRSKNLTITGTTTFNNQPTLNSIRHAYVQQQDILLPTLTVRETLRYSASLRLPASTTSSGEEVHRIVEEVILQLGLKECADTRIGDSEHRGCSGGEKRRTSIGVQLLANPSVLFLDEPTTGLDANSAVQVVRTLKNLAVRGRTVIITIHQPRSEIWSLFDRITLLSRGNPLYSGETSKAIGYFASLGHPFPEHVNPADFLIDLSAVDYRTEEAEKISMARIAELVAAWRELGVSILNPVENSKPASVKEAQGHKKQDMLAGGAGVTANRAPLWRQISVLTRRTIITTLRDPLGILGCLIEAISMGVIAGWIFYNLDGSLAGIRSREAALYISASLQGYLILLFETYRLTEVDIKVFDRERGEGVVGVLGFLISRRLAKLVTEDFAVPFLFSVIYYFLVGFNVDASQFFTFFCVIFVSQLITVSFATLSAGVSRNFSEAVLFGNLSYTVQSMACGYFIQSTTMPVYVRWTKYVSYNWYAFGALASNEFTNKFYDCPLPGGRDNPACIEYDGNFILDSIGFRKGWKAVPICINISWMILFYVTAGLLLRFKPVDISISSVKIKDDNGRFMTGKEKSLQVESRGKINKTIDVVLDNVKLAVQKPNVFQKEKREIEILKGISTRFEAGKLNVIMGPSGSGKSSLLNLMARRFHSSFSTRYRSSGKMFFNGALPSDTVIRSLCSYVTQDDDALLPSLTVRETLHFAAALRLPKWMAVNKKKRRAEEVIMKLGLKECADNLVGSEFNKGISGGEKRRVTIAVQILTEPRILLLDEPTSGLDAFTAASILSVLRSLADEGRTVISTIHQGRSDLFEKFGNILLLARGGNVVYSGKADQMLPYFSSLGHTCPITTNPADFALDLVTVDLQQAEKEAVSRAKVQTLIDRFDHNEALFVEDNDKVRKISLPAELGQMRREMAPFRIAYPTLVKRGLINVKRQPLLILARFMQVVGLGIILALFFAPLGNDYFSVQNRLGFIQQILPLYFVGMLQNVALYPLERNVFYKEHDDRAYGVEAFFAAYLTNEVPFELGTSLIFSVLADLAVGLPRTVKLFFVVTFNAFCITNCGESMGIFFNTLFQHTGFSINLMSTILSIGTFMGGIMSIGMPKFLEAFNYLSPLRYSVRNLAPYSLRGIKFTCTNSQRLPSGNCPISTGEQALDLYGLNTNPKINLVALAVTTVVYRVFAYVVLRIKRMNLGVRQLAGTGNGS